MSKKDWIFVVVIVLLLIFNIVSSIKLATIDRNIILPDSMYVVKNNHGDEYNAKPTGVFTKDELKQYSDSLFAEYEKIKKDNPVVITKTYVETHVDTLKIPTTMTTDNIDGKKIYNFNWDYSEQSNSNNYMSINGVTSVDSTLHNPITSLNSMRLGTTLTLDMVDNPDQKGTLRIQARSSNPRVNISNLEGAIINPKKNKVISSQFKQNKWSLGLHVGYGATFTGTSINVGPTISLGISRNILTF